MPIAGGYGGRQRQAGRPRTTANRGRVVLAASDALITGGATLLGVIVGALVAAGTDFALTHQRERADARAGARLVQVNLREAESTLADAHDVQYWMEGMDLPTEAWDAHRTVLASGLDAASWDAVANAATTLKRLDASAGRELARYEDPVAMSGWWLSEVANARGEVVAAYNALCRLAGTSPRQPPP
jgi:hypothetical protein